MLVLLAAAVLGIHAPDPDAYRVTKIRFVASPNVHVKGGRFTGSNSSATNDFETLATIDAEPEAGTWVELPVGRRPIYRYLKYEGPWETGAAISEVEFWAGDRKLSGAPFSTVADEASPTSAAFDGNPATRFRGKERNAQYVGIDLGAEMQVAAPTLSVKAGTYPTPIEVGMSTETPGAEIRFSWGGGTPTEESGDVYRSPLRIDKASVLVARAFKQGLAPSALTVAPYRIGANSQDRRLRTFHIGNSLTDTVVPWMEPIAAAAGGALEFHRFTIPGAPTDWLWDHPGSGFGDSRYREAFEAYAPFDHVVTQPFAGHGRDIENEADYSGRFFETARRYSPQVQPWLYVQWPTSRFDDAWAKGEGAVANLPGYHRPAKSFAEAIENHTRYTLAVRERAMADWRGRKIGVIPAGTALALLKARIDAGRAEGLTDLFRDCFSDDLHLNAKGAYLVSLVHYACFTGKTPEGKLGPLNSGLTPAQATLFQRIAWEAVQRLPEAQPQKL